MADDGTYVQARAALGRLSGGGYDLLNVDEGATYRLEGTAARLWEVLEAPATAATLASVLIDDSGAPPEMAARDVASFLGALVAAGLVERA